MCRISVFTPEIFRSFGSYAGVTFWYERLVKKSGSDHRWSLFTVAAFCGSGWPLLFTLHITNDWIRKKVPTEEDGLPIAVQLMSWIANVWK